MASSTLACARVTELELKRERRSFLCFLRRLLPRGPRARPRFQRSWTPDYTAKAGGEAIPYVQGESSSAGTSKANRAALVRNGWVRFENAPPFAGRVLSVHGAMVYRELACA
mmetsp:Transcript_17910/g.58253  ORF Transcript_17910/g.58253 Transcript_17910/m.58253 type:complete len:112 (-) Transcript_17910:219-554(-)